MDFLKILKSFEDFVYEALIWLVLLPKTLLAIVLHPLRMSAYVAEQLERPDEEAFGEAISPPLLLILCVLIAHLVDLAVRAQTPDTSGSLAGAILGSEQSMLLYRTISFGIWALAGATFFVVRTGLPLGRDSLRSPLYQQCYLVSPFALVQSIGVSLAIADHDPATVATAAVLTVAGFLWFVRAQVTWIQWRAHLPAWRGIVAGLAIVLAGSLANAVIGYALLHVDAPRTAQASADDGKA